MKIFTNKQFDELMNKHTSKIRSESYKAGYDKGYAEGHKSGLHEGLTRDKKGLIFTGTGLYLFDDGTMEEVMTKELNND